MHELVQTRVCCMKCLCGLISFLLQVQARTTNTKCSFVKIKLQKEKWVYLVNTRSLYVGKNIEHYRTNPKLQKKSCLFTWRFVVKHTWVCYLDVFVFSLFQLFELISLISICIQDLWDRKLIFFRFSLNLYIWLCLIFLHTCRS